MANNKQLDRLKSLLKDLFQLDQPELDFGLYKIMHAKSVQITSFLENDLIKEIESAFGARDGANAEQLIAQAKAKLFESQGDTALDANGELNPAFAALPAGKKYLEDMAAAQAAKDSLSADAEIYDHLYRFFERYYDNGDFLSRRYYARESDTRAAPYSVPYDGREVYLHWANKDQYYIKSGENFTHYTFDLVEAVKKLMESAKANGQDGGFDFDVPATATGEQKAMKVHLRIAEAQEGEHGNIKASGDQKREFIPLLSKPAELDTDGSLVLNFEYKVLTEGYPFDEAEIKAKFGNINKEHMPAHWMADVFLQAMVQLPEGQTADYMRLLSLLAPTDKQAKRPLLAKYISLYTARNTMDYFIHKDLGGFLRRELDFYIKNEVMRLDDIENADAPKVEQYLGKVKVLRRIAHQLIAFLAQLEDFQKKLWLKKKFVTEVNYCITLDRIPEKFYQAIAANEAQREEWVRLFAIQEIENPKEYTIPLTIDFLKANQYLLIDTSFYDESIKSEIIASIDGLDSMCEGVLVNSENIQALNLISRKYEKKITNVFIDPPYNTGDDGFLYKDAYSSSSWLTMVDERISAGFSLLKEDGVFFVSIGDEEQEHLSTLLRSKYGKDRFFANLIWEKKKKGSFLSGQIAKMKDYILCVAKNIDHFDGLIGEIATDTETYPCVNAANPREIRKIPAGISSKYREKDFILSAGEVISAGNMDLVLHSDLIVKDGLLASELLIEGNWRYSQENMSNFAVNHELYLTQDLYLRRIVNEPRYKRLKDLLLRKGDEADADFRQYDVNDLNKYGWGTNEDANDELHQLMGEQYAASYPKPSKLLTLLLASSRHKDGYWLDYFAGSGTTGHAVIDLNKGDNSKRKYILIEMGAYFDDVLRSRICKNVYSENWTDGKPLGVRGISHLIKYVRLESYEDALNNLIMSDDVARDRALYASPELRSSYMMNYWLDVETQGSPSLLNVQAFADPTNYVMKIKKPGSDALALQRIDLIETFNWLIGLWVEHLAAPQTFNAEFEREIDKDLPKDQNTRLVCKRLKQDDQGPYWFRLVEGYTLKVPGDNSSRQKTLVVWRKLTDNPEQDNAALQKFLLEKLQISPRENTYAVIYVNGSHTLPNPLVEAEQTKVRLIEEAFHAAMWSQEAN